MVEVLADEVLGAKSHNEHVLLMAKLGGTRNNWVFAFFGIKASRRAAEARLIKAEEKKKAKEAAAPRGGKTTGTLEKKKQRTSGGRARVTKRPRLMETLFSEFPLHSKGDSEAEVGSSEDSAAPEKNPPAPISAARSLLSRCS